MFPPARLADPVTHDMIVPSGIIMPPCMPTVLIEFLPAARVTDLVACTGMTSMGPAHPPPVPPAPPGLPIVTGNPTIMIGFLPAARWIRDIAACGTFLGDPKLLATRRVFFGPQ